MRQGLKVRKRTATVPRRNAALHSVTAKLNYLEPL